MITDTHPFVMFLLACLAGGGAAGAVLLGYNLVEAVFGKTEAIPDQTVQDILQEHYKKGDTHGRTYHSEGWW